jgi:hypothetical protein
LVKATDYVKAEGLESSQRQKKKKTYEFREWGEGEGGLNYTLQLPANIIFKINIFLL